MAKTQTKAQVQITRGVFAYLAFIGAAILIIIAGLAWWGHVTISNMVTHELSVQKIYFPEKGSAALDPETYPGLQQYAGQLVDTPDKAKAYANEYIGKHLEQIAGGKTYSEVSAAAKADPTNATLQQQKAVLFQGETLRGLLLTSGYGFGTIGIIAGIAAFTALGAAALLICVGYSLRR